MDSGRGSAGEGPTALSPMQRLYLSQCNDVVRGGLSRPKPSRTVLLQYIPSWEQQTRSHQTQLIRAAFGQNCNDSTAATAVAAAAATSPSTSAPSTSSSSPSTSTEAEYSVKMQLRVQSLREVGELIDDPKLEEVFVRSEVSKVQNLDSEWSAQTSAKEIGIVVSWAEESGAEVSTTAATVAQLKSASIVGTKGLSFDIGAVSKVNSAFSKAKPTGPGSDPAAPPAVVVGRALLSWETLANSPAGVANVYTLPVQPTKVSEGQRTYHTALTVEVVYSVERISNESDASASVGAEGSEELPELDIDLGLVCAGDDGSAAIFDTLRLYGSGNGATSSSATIGDQKQSLRIGAIKCPSNDIRQRGFDALVQLLLSPNGRRVRCLDLRENPFLAIEAVQHLIRLTGTGFKPRGQSVADSAAATDRETTAAGSTTAAPSSGSHCACHNLFEVQLDGTNVPPHFRRRLEQNLAANRSRAQNTTM